MPQPDYAADEDPISFIVDELRLFAIAWESRASAWEVAQRIFDRLRTAPQPAPTRERIARWRIGYISDDWDAGYNAAIDAVLALYGESAGTQGPATQREGEG